MAKVYKVEMFVNDPNQFYNGKNHLITDIENSLYDGSIHVKEVKESAEFEWEDELEINYTNATAEDYEEYFK